MKRWLVALVTFALVSAACTAGGSDDEPSINADASASHEPVTIEMWSAWTSKAELEDFDKIFASFEEAYPWITVKSVGNVDTR